MDGQKSNKFEVSTMLIRRMLTKDNLIRDPTNVH